MKNCLIVVFFFLLCIPAGAQVPVNAVFRHIQPEALGVNELYAQTLDRNGNVWMGSDKGLLCYNGYSSFVFSHKNNDKNTPLANEIQALYVDASEKIWLAYQTTGGVSCFDPVSGRFKHYLPDSSNEHSVPDARIIRFKTDKQNRFWILTWGNGMIQMDPKTGYCTVYTPTPIANRDDFRFNPKIIPHDKVKALAELKDGRFLLGFFGEGEPAALPVYFDAGKKVFEPFPLQDYKMGVNEHESWLIKSALHIIHFIHEDERQNLWFGTYSGLIFFDTKNHTATRISGHGFDPGRINLDNTRSYVMADPEHMWIGTPNKGLMVVDLSSRQAGYLQHSPEIPTSIADNRIVTMTKDPDDNIWISTGTGGLSIYSPLIQQFDILPWENMDLDFTNQSEQAVPVQQMYVKGKNEIYVSSENGLTIFDGERYNIVQKIRLPAPLMQQNDRAKTSYRIGNFKFLGDERLLIISPEVPRVYDFRTNRVTPVNLGEMHVKGGIRILFRHKKDHGRVYLFCNNPPGIYEYDLKSNKIKYLFWPGTPFVKGDARNIFISEAYSHILPNKKWLLAAGKNKFVIADPVDTSYTVYGPAFGNFPDSTINTAYLDPEGQTWICCDNGLYHFDWKTGKTVYWSDKIDIPLLPVKSMTTDKNGIRWLALEKFIVRWDPSTNKTFVYRSELGLNVGSFIGSVAQTDEDGKIYMASINGILRFDPGRLKVPDVKPLLHLSFLSIKDDTLKGAALKNFAQKETILNWNENFLTLEFASNQVYTPAPHRFYYRLIGLDSTWQDNGTSNRLRYTNLSHGDYTLEIKLLNVYNIESEILKIRFHITRPYWLTWWFYLLLAVVLFLGIWLMVRLRERAHRKREEELEQGIRERTAEIVAKAEEIRLQKDIIEDKNKELTDSIHYAQKIQQSILPGRDEMLKYLPEHFILFQPKDIVSGDFYWFSHQQDSVLWAVVDCTGHGVPGGFMSMLGAGLLNQIVNEEKKLEPGEILNQLRERVIIALKQTGSIGENRDGMDISLCRYIPSRHLIQFAGANNPLYILRNGELMELAADKQPIGIHAGEKKPFRQHEITVEKGDRLYMSSDGYADQFGGEKGKKFKTSNFEKLLVTVSKKTMQDQLLEIEKTFVDWKGDFEQLDDVCAIGVKL